MATATRLCRYCKARKRREEMILVPVGAFCDAGHAFQWAQDNAERAREKARQKRSQQASRETREMRRRFKENDYTYQFDLTKKAAQKLANRLDQKLGCVSCDCPRTVQFCGGHFKTVGGHRELALDLRNIHGQCNRNCNRGLSGNISGTKTTRGYRAGLLERYGQAFVEFLDAYHPPQKRTGQELIAMRKEYLAEIRRLERGEPPSRNWRALPAAERAA